MKLFNPKTAAISLASLGVAFIGGMALVGLMARQQPTASHPQTFTPSAATSTPQSSDTAAAPDTASAPAAPSTTTTSTDPSTVSGTNTSASGTSTSGTTSTTTTTTQSDPTPPLVTAISAAISGWSAPVPTDSKFGLQCTNPSQCQPGTTQLPTVILYRYCIWTYSDGSTQQQTYDSKYSTLSGDKVIYNESTYDCTVANAPAAN